MDLGAILLLFALLLGVGLFLAAPLMGDVPAGDFPGVPRGILADGGARSRHKRAAGAGF